MHSISERSPPQSQNTDNGRVNDVQSVRGYQLCRPRSSVRCRGRPGTPRCWARAVSSKPWSIRAIASSTKTRCRAFCGRRRSPASISSPTATRISTKQVGGMSWQSYPLTHMDGFRQVADPATYKVGAVAYPRGHILHDFLEARVSSEDRRAGRTRQPAIRRDVEDGAAHDQEADQVRDASCRSCSPRPCEDDYYKDPVERTWALSDAHQRGAQRARRCRLSAFCRWRSRRFIWCRCAARRSASSMSMTW